MAAGAAGSVAIHLAGLLVLPAAIGFAIWRSRRTLALGAGWILTLLIPAIAFPLVTYMADRYLYAPSLGFCWLLAAGILAVGNRIVMKPLRWAVVGALAAVPFAVFTVRTLQYLPVWTDSEHLWTYAIERSRDYRVYNNLAQVRIDQQRWDEAETLLMYALGRSDLDQVRNNMARVRIQQKRWTDAESLLVLTTSKDNLVSYQSLAVTYYNTKRYRLALQAIERAREVALQKGADPREMADVEYTRGAIYWVLSRREEAIAAWEAALRANPNHPRAREWLATARGASTPSTPAR